MEEESEGGGGGGGAGYLLVDDRLLHDPLHPGATPPVVIENEVGMGAGAAAAKEDDHDEEASKGRGEHQWRQSRIFRSHDARLKAKISPRLNEKQIWDKQNGGERKTKRRDEEIKEDDT